MQNGTWKLVELPTGRDSSGYKLVFKRKVESVSTVAHFKARFVLAMLWCRLRHSFRTSSRPKHLASVARGPQTDERHHIDVRAVYLHGRL